MTARQEGGDSLRARLLTIAFALLAEVDGPGAARVVVTVEDPDRHTTLRLQGEPEADEEPPGLSPAERKILAAASVEPKNARTLARLAGYKFNSHVSAAVRSLCRKGLLQRVEHDTYRLPPS